MQKWLLQLYLFSDSTVWQVLDKGWTWNIIDIQCVMLLIYISGIFIWILYDFLYEFYTFDMISKTVTGSSSWTLRFRRLACSVTLLVRASSSYMEAYKESFTARAPLRRGRGRKNSSWSGDSKPKPDLRTVLQAKRSSAKRPWCLWLRTRDINFGYFSQPTLINRLLTVNRQDYFKLERISVCDPLKY